MTVFQVKLLLRLSHGGPPHLEMDLLQSKQEVGGSVSRDEERQKSYYHKA